MAAFSVPLIIRGQVFEGAELEFEGRRGGTRFVTPDLERHLVELPLARPSALADLYELTFDDILDYLSELSGRLALERNAHLQQALELSLLTSGLTEGILRSCYATLGRVFEPDVLREMVEGTIGVRYLEGWVDTRTATGYCARMRAFGARAVHIVAGNVPTVSAITIARNAVTRSDAIIKTPSNDPLTAAAIARTMIDMAPDHPVTRHLSIAYWKGGDAAIEDVLYRPQHIEKIVAWGGVASISHIAKYIQPGIDLITLDPKLSSTIIGREAFASESSMRDAALALAHDVGAYNQEACLSARVVYVETGTDAAGLATANRFGQRVFEAIQQLPREVSGVAREMAAALREELEGLRFASDYKLVAGGGLEGGVIVSQIPEPVEFAALLANRIANLVPVSDMELPVRSVTAYTQTIGVYPESLAERIRDRLAFQGAQRVVTLGYAANRVVAGPQDGIEPLRRMCKWILHESSDPAIRPMVAYG
jgi:Acyl-CoA reductase (LuxC)